MLPLRRHLYCQNLVQLQSGAHVYRLGQNRSTFFLIGLRTQAPSSKGTEMTEFALVAVHVQPKNAAAEIDHLDDVTAWTKMRLG